MKKTIFLSLLMLISFNALAKQQTLTLSLPTMNCVTCPYTVKMALSRVDGVSKADVSYKTKQAVVVFDDAKITAKDLVQTTTNAGYPSTVINN